MTDSTWPNEPHRRKTVLVLNQHEIDALEYREGGAELLLNEEVYILPSSSQQSNSVVQGLFDSGLARPGAVLIQSPFDKDVYEDLKKAVERFGLEKHLYFSALCGFLGARKVTVEQVEDENTKDKIIFSAKGDVPIRGSGEVKLENEELTSFSNRLNLMDEFAGGSPNVPAAKEFLERKGLLGDATMKSLLEMCQNPNNPFTSRKLQLNMTGEVQRNLNVLARLDISALSLEADYDRHVKEQTEFTLTIKVEF